MKTSNPTTTSGSLPSSSLARGRFSSVTVPMRLFVEVCRHGLPPSLVTWLVNDDNKHLTVAGLLSEIDQVFSLESEEWSLEDYILELNGFECLQWQYVRDVLHADDQITIRPLQTNELKSRRITGRDQIAADGRHLHDGVAFGRPRLSQPVRPTVIIPPRRPRLAQGGDMELADLPLPNTVDAESFAAFLDELRRNSRQVTLSSESAASPDSRNRSKVSDKRVQFASAGADLDSDDEDDEDFGLPESESDVFSEETESDEDREAESDSGSEAKEVDANVGRKVSKSNLRVPVLDGARKSKSESPLDSGSSSDADSDSEPNSGPDSESDSDSDSDSLSPSSSSEESGSESDSDSSSDLAPEELPARAPMTNGKVPSNKVSTALTVTTVPPGQGRKNTQERNKRRRQASKLKRLKEQGLLHANANLRDLARLEQADGVTESESGNQANTGTPNSHEPNGTAHRGRAEAVDAELVRARWELLERLGIVNGDAEPQPLPTLIGPVAPTHDAHAGAKHSRDASDEDEPPSTAKRARLDVPSSRRMIMNSLGKRTKGKKPKEPEAPPESPEAPEPTSEPEDPETWRSKVRLAAVECVYDNDPTSAPPFPFEQRWDASQRWEDRGKKRKRAVKRNAARKVGEEYDDYDVDHEYEEDGNDWHGNHEDEAVYGANGLDYDEKPADPPSPDLAPLPEDPTILPTLTRDDLKEGAIIALRMLEISAATSWQPVMSPWRTARVLDDVYVDNADPEIVLEYAKRDREVREERYDRNGRRLYDKFEAVDTPKDDGIREVRWSDISEGRLVACGYNVGAGGQEGVDGAAVEVCEGSCLTPLD
ncbi:hypothetical protein EJ06DRAFT_581108 [Trichodelitschia bisporula]|uniref:DUF7357 domain-containing protein n=1 Tax=Trichodelitschia bisporula TaxID=703511 RepID=A0A6G1I1M7_9PEZI|nr:hypothetical protein EJ06DRAFT_581108 [Trichodelitschia bisporula]